MSDSPFAAPAEATGISWSDFKGCLLLVEPKSVETDIKTSYGVAERVVRADVAVLDGPHAGTEIPDTLIFPKVLVNQTAARIGEKVLGRLGQGDAKPGQSAPWKLQPATQEDQDLGMRWLNRTTQPAAAEPPAQQQGTKVPF